MLLHIGIQREGKTVMMPEVNTEIIPGDVLWIVGPDQNVEEFMAATA